MGEQPQKFPGSGISKAGGSRSGVVLRLRRMAVPKPTLPEFAFLCGRSRSDRPGQSWARRVSGDLEDQLATDGRQIMRRSEERRVGKEGVSTCRSRWSRDP